MTTSNKKLAVLIDADNAPADVIDRLLEEIAKYGIASVKRIYGDWSHGLSKWKAALLPHAIIPVQQFAYTKGKNATDMALVIDAMDLLYSNNFDGFCLVSSDSDFTRLASRIRESGLEVYGFGEKKTPESFRQACDKFTYLEIFRPQKTQPNKNHQPTRQPTENNGNQDTAKLTHLIKRAVKENADDLGWANLGPIGSYISKISPDFDSRLYGYSKLSDLIKSLDLFEHRSDNNQLQIRSIKKNHQTFKNNPQSESAPHLAQKNASASITSNIPAIEENTTKNVLQNHDNTTDSHAEKTQISDASMNLEVSGSLEAKEAPKKRGRKPKNAISTENENLATIEDSNNLSGSLLETEEPKKRGRKPKKLEEQNTPAEEMNPSGSLESKEEPKKRGRKPKKSTSEANDDATELSGSLSETENAHSIENQQEIVANETVETTTVDSEDVTLDMDSGTARKNKVPFSRIIPKVQQIVEKFANQDGWVSLNRVARELDKLWDSRDYGYADNRELIRSVYTQWLEIRRINKTESVRINKRFVVKEL